MGEEKKKSHGIMSFIKTKGRLPLLVGGAALGILLLLFGGAGDGKVVAEERDEVALRAAELLSFEERIENEIAAMCEAVAGVSDCEVMVTFESGYSAVYVTNKEKEPVTVGSGSSEKAIFDAVSPPSVSGVGIVCRGGNSDAVRATLTDLVSTMLGIPTNRVYVTGK